eukprot:1738023-Rhodomonas_salina.1
MRAEGAMQTGQRWAAALGREARGLAGGQWAGNTTSAATRLIGLGVSSGGRGDGQPHWGRRCSVTSVQNLH